MSEKTCERSSQTDEDEELRARRLKLERVHAIQHEKEAALEEERADLRRQRRLLEQEKQELVRQQKELDEGRRIFAYSIAQLGTPKKE